MANKFEEKVKMLFERNDFTVLQSGWPDFLVKRHGRYSGIAAVEVKQGHDKVRPNQLKMHNMLKEAGIPVYVIRPEDLGDKTKKRFKKIINITDYKNMIDDINRLEHGISIKEDYYLREIEQALKYLSQIRERIDELADSQQIESVILSKEIHE